LKKIGKNINCKVWKFEKLNSNTHPKNIKKIFFKMSKSGLEVLFKRKNQPTLLVRTNEAIGVSV
jgi:hypothetical protein